jgi:hypothetical protein
MNTTLIIGLIALAVILVVTGYFLLRKALREQEPELAKFDENPLDAFVETEGEDPVKHEEECKQTACDIMEAGNIICEEANKPEPMVELDPTYTMTEELAGKVLDKVEDTPKVAVVTGENEITEVTKEEIEKISDEDLKNIAKALKPAKKSADKKSTDKKRSRKEKTNDTKKTTEKTVKPSKSTPKKTKPRQNEAVNGKKNKKKPAKKNSKKK